MSQGENVCLPFPSYAFLLALEIDTLLQGLSIPLAQHLWPILKEKQPRFLHIRSYTQYLRISNPIRACMHTLMALSCICVQIKFVASSQNSTPRRTLPRVQDLLQEGKAIKNEAFHCKFEFPYIVKAHCWSHCLQPTILRHCKKSKLCKSIAFQVIKKEGSIPQFQAWYESSSYLPSLCINSTSL